MSLPKNTLSVTKAAPRKTRREMLAARLLLGCATALLITTAAPMSEAFADQKIIKAQSGKTSGQRVKLGLNKSLVVDLPSDAYDILVANPAVADAVTRTARRIYLFGKQVGETNIFVFGPNGEQIASLDVAVERDVAGLEDYLKRFIPNSDIQVELINDNVVLTGTVETPLDASRAKDIAQMFVTGGEATTGQYSQSASAPTDGGGVAINNPDEKRQESRIINMLQILGEDQVTLKVTVAEVSRDVMKQLGVNMLGQGSVDGISWGALTENPFLLGKSLSNSRLKVGGSGNSIISGYLNAMEQAGVMRTLAEPALTAVSGEKATFRVGGEFNLVDEREIDENGTKYTIKQIEYGIGLEFQPTVLTQGRISLKIRTQVSEPTMRGGVPMEGGFTSGGSFLNGMNFISIRKRLADTTVELPSGGSMMIAGLVQDDVRQAFSGTPGLSKLPVLGSLFRSRDFVRNETELVIIVTPYLSKPSARTALAKPDDNFTPASDGAGMFLGRVNRVYGTMKTNLPNGRYHGVVGYIYK